MLIPITVTDAGITIDVIGHAKYLPAKIVVVPAGMVTDDSDWIEYLLIPGLDTA